MDAGNAVYSTTYEIDRKLGTHYFENFVNFWKAVQDNDWTVDGAMTDPKGNRGLSPSAQEDPDLYLRVVERRADGIVVRGAKAHQTGIVNSHEILVMPTVAMKPEEKRLCGFIRGTRGRRRVFMIYGRQSCDTRKMEEGADIDLGNSQYGGHEALIILTMCLFRMRGSS